MGAGTSLTQNMPWNSCLQDISSILVNAYSIYVYIYRNIDTNDAAYAIYASSYAVSLIGKCTYIRCGENEVSLQDALLGGDPSLSAGAKTIEQQINEINQNANKTLTPTNNTESNGNKAEEDKTDDPWANNDPWAFKTRKENKGIKRQSYLNNPFGYDTNRPANTKGTIIDSSTVIDISPISF